MARGVSFPRADRQLGQRRLALSARAQEAGFGYLLLLPSLLGLLVYTIGPVLYGFAISFTHFNGFGTPHFTGLRNYQLLLSDDTFWRSLGTTALLTAVIVPLSIGLALGLALLLNRKLPLRNLLRTLFFIPSAVPLIAAVVVFMQFFDARIGMVNQMLMGLGMPSVDWLAPDHVFWAVIAVTVWQGYGVSMLIYLAALQDVPEQLYDAAKVDGAGQWKRFWYVTRPSLAPVTLFIVVISVIGSMQMFSQAYIMGQSNGYGETTPVLTVAIYAYQTGIVGFQYGYGTAIMWGLFVVLFGFSIIQLRLSVYGTSRREER